MRAYTAGASRPNTASAGVCMCVSPHRVLRPLSRRDGLRPDGCSTVLPPTAEAVASTCPARAGAAPGASAMSPRRPSYTPVAPWLLPLNDDCDGALTLCGLHATCFTYSLEALLRRFLD